MGYNAILSVFMGLLLGTSIQTNLDNGGRTISVAQENSRATVDFMLAVVLVQYHDLDSDCDVETQVQFVEQTLHQVSPGTTRVLNLSELELKLPDACDAYIVTALAFNPTTGERNVTSFVSESVSSQLGTVDCTQPPQSTLIASDLVLTNEIDLNAIPIGSCLGLREYSAQLRNTAETTSYGVSINSKYICTKNLTVPNSCNSSPPAPLPGPGWNQGVESPAGGGILNADQCFPLEYRNDSNFFSLPNCCDNLNVLAIAQCTSFTVTSINGQACSPAFISTTTFSSETRGGAVQFGCNFFPTNHVTAESFSCVGDCDVDGTTDGCESSPEEMDAESPPDGVCNGVDNCPLISNPDQQNSDSDSFGDACDNCTFVSNPAQVDSDGDNHGGACDCDDQAAGVWSIPGEVVNLSLFFDEVTSSTTLDWDAPSNPGGGVVAYDTLRSVSPEGFVTQLTCVESNDSTDTSASDSEVAGGLRYYLIRAVNTCPGSSGSLGNGANGGRDGGACP